MGGFGFVKTSEGEFFVPAGKTGSAFDGDMVEVALLPDRRRGASHVSAGNRSGSPQDEKRVARVVRVLGRAHETIIGRYEVADPFGVVVPEDPRLKHDIFTLRADNPDIPDGSLVRVRITSYPARDAAATGVIADVLGDADEGDFGVDLIIARHKLETEFSPAACEQARSATCAEQDALASGYRDVTDRRICTIDPDDARDFDDALSIARVEGLWRIGVHIADVSHYVPWDSPLDMDARRRATSVYLVDRVIPMLPEELSCDVCSLKPGEVRRSLTVDLYVTDTADLVRYDIYPALIRSTTRFTYGQVQALLDDAARRNGEGGVSDFSLSASSTSVLDMAEGLVILSRLAQKRARARAAAGGLDFDTREAKVRLDGDGRAYAIDIREKTQATQLVEEMMIFANEVVARYLAEREHPCIYRVHGQPSSDALGSLIAVMQEFDWFAQVDECAFMHGNPHAIAAVLAAVENRPEAELMGNLVLRAMQRAVYSPLCDGHFGLASAAYCHFTSPIRRYPDLVVHRMVKDQLMRDGKMPSHAASGSPEGRAAKEYARQCAQIKWLSEHSSEMERIADTAARQSQEYKMIEYLQGCVGQRFSAVISGVASYGIYVRLDNTAEGMVPIRDLGNEYFILDAQRYVLTGDDTGRQFRLGGRVAVVLREADPRTRTLRFALVRS